MKIKGVVIKGKQKGKGLGFPTANLVLGKESRAKSGIYGGKVCLNGREYKAAIFVGEGDILEAHVLGFSGSLYGEEIEVEIGRKVRDIKRFKNDEELKKQIRQDILLIQNL